MKKHWLRGLLLGVSLTLLVAGGAALAQGLSVTVDKECIECWEGTPGPGVDPPASLIAELQVLGFDPAMLICGVLRADGEVMAEIECTEPPALPPALAYIHASCPEYADQAYLWLGPYADAPDFVMPLVLGDWTLEVWQEPYDDAADDGFAAVSVNLRIARVCEVEFVPEPGTIALLGSGLAGLAGYAALRWRARS